MSCDGCSDSKRSPKEKILPKRKQRINFWLEKEPNLFSSDIGQTQVTDSDTPRAAARRDATGAGGATGRLAASGAVRVRFDAGLAEAR